MVYIYAQLFASLIWIFIKKLFTKSLYVAYITWVRIWTVIVV